MTVLRDKGTYGRVTVFIYSQPIEARRGGDYSFTDQPLVFQDGESRKEVTIQIFEDNTPEDDESLELILNNPQGGLVIGEPGRGKITRGRPMIGKEEAKLLEFAGRDRHWGSL